MAEQMNKEMEASLQDLHRGVHLAMDALIHDKDLDQAELILRQIDEHLTGLINAAKVLPDVS